MNEDIFIALADVNALQKKYVLLILLLYRYRKVERLA